MEKEKRSVNVQNGGSSEESLSPDPQPLKKKLKTEHKVEIGESSRSQEKEDEQKDPSGAESSREAELPNLVSNMQLGEEEEEEVAAGGDEEEDPGQEEEVGEPGQAEEEGGGGEEVEGPGQEEVMEEPGQAGGGGEEVEGPGQEEVMEEPGQAGGGGEEVEAPGGEMEEAGPAEAVVDPVFVLGPVIVGPGAAGPAFGGQAPGPAFGGPLPVTHQQVERRHVLGPNSKYIKIVASDNTVYYVLRRALMTSAMLANRVRALGIIQPDQEVVLNMEFPWNNIRGFLNHFRFQNEP